jgi:hypothetical protein
MRTQEGQGKLVERMYREVRAAAIPGGSEEILLDFAIRQVAAKANSRTAGHAVAAAAGVNVRDRSQANAKPKSTPTVISKL